MLKDEQKPMEKIYNLENTNFRSKFSKSGYA